MRFVVDASVVYKTLVGETDSDMAISIVRAGAGAPDLLFSEVANVLWKAHRRGEITFANVLRASSLLTRLNIEVAEGQKLNEAALRHAIALNHAAYDCFYLALAGREGVPMVTADASFQRKVAAAASPIEVLLVAEAAGRL